MNRPDSTRTHSSVITTAIRPATSIWPCHGSYQSCSCSDAYVLPARHAPVPVLVPLFNRGFQPHLDQMQHLPIDNPPSYTPKQCAVRNGIEVFGQICVNYIGVAFTKQSVYFPNRVLRASLRSIGVGVRIQIRLKDRLDYQLGSGLYHPVPNRRNPQWPFAASGLWDHHPPHRLWFVRLRAKFFPDTVQPLRHSS